MPKPRLLDLFCKAGGCSVGYHRAGFEVVGVDLEPQPNYPYEFHEFDALKFDLSGFDAIHASPPCQAYSRTRFLPGRTAAIHPDLIPATRDMLRDCGVPWIIENVELAPLRGPVTLCGTMFDLLVYRHRGFESDGLLTAPTHRTHTVHMSDGRAAKYFKAVGEMATIAGHLFSLEVGQRCLDIDWMTKDELAQAIPPAYTEYLGRQLIQRLES